MRSSDMNLGDYEMSDTEEEVLHYYQSIASVEDYVAGMYRVDAVIMLAASVPVAVDQVLS